MNTLRKLLSYRLRLSIHTTDSGDYRRHGVGYWFKLYNELIDMYCEEAKK